MTAEATGDASVGGPAAVAAMRERALAALRGALGEDLGRPYALVDFPRHSNLGDSAIWLGTLACLEAVGAPPPAWTCDDRTFRADELARAVPDGPVLILGGGNFGDLHPRHEALREQVVATFPDRRVVQLPQTIHFDEPAPLARARRVLSAHRHLHVLVRDAQSLAKARDQLGLDAHLAPDLAVGLLPRPATGARVPRVLWLARGDEWNLHEAPEAADDVEVGDWPDEGYPWGRRRVRLLGGLVRAGLGRVLPVRRALMASYEPLSRWRLERGLATVSRAAVVVTDRLHGHLLCLLAGTPHVLLDDATGKVSAYHEAWSRGTPGVVLARDAADALRAARAMLAQVAR